MSDHEAYDDEEHVEHEPPSKRRKTGTDSYVVPVDDQAEDDDEDAQVIMDATQPSTAGLVIAEEEEEEDDLDGFIANEEEVEAELEAAEQLKRKQRRKKKKKKRGTHKKSRITEDELRLVAEARGERYKPDIDIDADVLDDDDDDESDNESDGAPRRTLRVRVADFDEESIMGHPPASSTTHSHHQQQQQQHGPRHAAAQGDDDDDMDDDEFHDYGDDDSMDGDYDARTRKRGSRGGGRGSGAAAATYEDVGDFVVDDDGGANQRYAYAYETGQVDKLYSIFGKHVYDFLGIPRTQQHADDLSDDEQEAEQALRATEAAREKQKQRLAQKTLDDIEKGLAGLDDAQKQRVADIIHRDVPERLQPRIEKTDEVQMSTPEIDREVRWILRQSYFVGAQAESAGAIKEEDVAQILRWLRVEHYDVPYIATYLQDEYSNAIKPMDIWKMDALDEQYLEIYLRRRGVERQCAELKAKLLAQQTQHRHDDAGEAGLQVYERWLQRVQDAEVFLAAAATHEALEAVDAFLNIVPVVDGSASANEDDALAVDGARNGSRHEVQFPEAPDTTAMMTPDAVDLVHRFVPQECHDREQLEDVAAQIGEKLAEIGDTQELQLTELDIAELAKLRDFYLQCAHHPEMAAELECNQDDYQGEEAFKFMGASQTDAAELQDTVAQIERHAHELSEYRSEKLRQNEIETRDYGLALQYFERCVEVMPKHKKTKKAASMRVPRGGGGGGGEQGNGRNKSFKFSIPRCLLPICEQIGFSHALCDNVRRFGARSYMPSTLQNVHLETDELAPLVEAIVSHTQWQLKYPTPKEVEQDVVYHMARVLGHEPVLRLWVSEQLKENGVISTQPTLKGRDLVEWTDELAAVKRLREKPIVRFLDDSTPNNSSSSGSSGLPLQAPARDHAQLHWLLIHKGSSAGLLRNHMAIPQHKLDELRVQCAQELGYLSPAYDHTENTIQFFLYKLAPLFIHASSSDACKSLKLRILHDALNLHLIPCAVRWLHAHMLQHDEERVIENACKELKYIANVAGERPRLIHKNMLSIVVGEENSPSFFVLLNHFGDVIDDMMLHFMKTHIRLNPANNAVISTHDRLQLDKKNSDLALFKDFVEQHKPELIVIDAGNLLARNFKSDIEKVLSSYDSTADIRVEFVDPCVSLLYRNSDDATKEFQSWSVGQRQAVSLGRFVLDPISELTRRWCTDAKTGQNELLSLPLHKNMNDVEGAKLLKAFRRVLMDITCEVGVLLNMAAQRDFLNGPIQFLSGLGPRKAQHLIYELKRRGRFSSRQQIQTLNILGQQCCRNAIGFIRINRHLDRPSSSSSNDAQRRQRRRHRSRRRRRRNDDDDDDDDDDEDDDEDEESESESDDEDDAKVELLDDTRIHPSDYHWARVVVISAMEIEDGQYGNDKLEELRAPESLHKLESLNLDIFSERILLKRGVRIVAKLYLIKSEIRQGFKEQREPFKSPENDMLYHLLCGQTRASLREGMLINVEIKSITASGIRCRLPSCGLDAWLPAENVTVDIREKFMAIKNKYNGDTILDQCRTERKDLILSFLKQKTHLETRVISIDKAKFSVKLSCLSADLENLDQQHEVPLNADEYLVSNHPDDDSKSAIQRDIKQRLKNRPLRRNITYTAFHNISRDEAEEKLKACKGFGQLIFRPSSRGLNYLSMTWKMADNPDIFVNYLVEERDKPNPYAIGAKLVIDKEEYDDLDEIYTVLRPRLNELTQAMINHQYFRYGTEMDIQEMLQDEASVHNKTCYALSYSYDRPGHFLLSYILAATRSSSSGSPQKSGKKVHREYIGLMSTGFKFRKLLFENPNKLINWWKMNFRKNHPVYVKKMKLQRQHRHETQSQSLNDDVMFDHNNNNNNERGRRHHPHIPNNTPHRPPMPLPPHQHHHHHGNGHPSQAPPPHHPPGDGYRGYNNNNSNNEYRRRSRSREPRRDHESGGGYNSHYDHQNYNRY